ncbi:MAG TPA: DUF1207 domain-containing protein [Bacteroides sp.]|nr:DUF1207 domain-containing protein [Bacteroides sp.]
MKYAIALIILMNPILISVSGQEADHRLFRESGMMKPFLAEMRSPAFKGELAFLNKLDQNYYAGDISGRPLMEIHLGTRLPVYSLVNELKRIGFFTGGFIGNVLLIDMFEQTTAPVINTDYFFGFQAGLVKYLDQPYIRNIGLLMVPVFHESTHLGDEFSLHGYQEIPGFTRINVSYEAWEIAAVINDPGNLETNLLSAKAGFHRLWNHDRGYYATDSLETKGMEVPASTKNYACFLQLNLQRTGGFLCSENWMQVISAEVSNRLKFSYEPGFPEKRTWNINLYLGWKCLVEGSGRNIGFFVRYYRGINPHGQFRNTDGFRYVALSIVYH